MSTLPSSLRRQLESAVKQARKVAAAGARKALEALAVHESDPYAYMDGAQIELRRKLRAQAIQLGDKEVLGKPGSCEIKHLIEKLAYDQWHRLLFARYLVENNLLISPVHGVAVSLDDCEELAPSLGLKDSWAVAAHFAATELPEIFRTDDPAGAVELPAENRKPLIQLVTQLPTEVFTAGDSLGWCYQFWQAEKKEEVNREGNKIGADELPAVTQLFTEDYMVDFLLDNTLGAWHAGKWLAANQLQAQTVSSEEHIRTAVALPGCQWEYLRFVKDGDNKWTPAAGLFGDWPKGAKDVTCLDPCMGSGHFIVAMFERMVALRIAEEALSESEAVASVIRDNVFGLEIDPRCTQIAAFNLALSAWRRVGHCTLPPMNLACCGLAPNTKKGEWLKLAGSNDRVRNGMARVYDLFEEAPLLGSLINPLSAGGDLMTASFHELQPLLERALDYETSDEATHEIAVTARGLAKAAEILGLKFALVATNVPYLGRGKQNAVLQDYCAEAHREAKAELATCFVERSLELGGQSSAIALVTSQNWWFSTGYAGFRKKFLRICSIQLAASLGEEAWQEFGERGPIAVLMVLKNAAPAAEHQTQGIDVRSSRTIDLKISALLHSPLSEVLQSDQLKNPDSRILLDSQGSLPRLSAHAFSVEGMSTGDSDRYLLHPWEVETLTDIWEPFQRSPDDSADYSGARAIVRWESGRGTLSTSDEARVQGNAAWGRRGVVVNMMRHLNVALSIGAKHDKITAVIIPREPDHLPALWAFCKSESFFDEVRRLNPGVQPGTGTLVKVPYDSAHWLRIASERFPDGLPVPVSRDPTQWLFNGHPKASDDPLQVAVARLLGYRWPRQTGLSLPDCPALGSDGLEILVDTDGIVCLSATKGEPAASERLRGLLVQAYGEDWSTSLQEDLLARVGYAGKTLDDWLRDGFFEQHCALFHHRPSLHHRPFIWHIWDGNKNGFSALVNYHKLNYATLEALTYSTLGLWIQRQHAAVDAGEAGSDSRLQAAKQLQAKLKLILEGEPPYDLFVRWKPLSQQAIGWHPDLNDGVRMNIRPFATADILRKRVKIKWDKDRGKEPVRNQKDFPWFWGWNVKTQDFAGAGTEPDGNRWNDLHYTNEAKRKARGE